MRKRLHAVLVGLVAILGVGLVAPAPAGAIPGGTVDTANKYDNVGIIAFSDATGRYRCTATLVTPTVLLTAAHCTTGTLGKTIVNFDWFIDAAPPSNLPRAVDDGRGVTGAQGTKDVSVDHDCFGDNYSFHDHVNDQIQPRLSRRSLDVCHVNVIDLLA